MEFGLFNSACVLPQFAGDEHRRILDEVAIVQAADRVGFKYTWATEHHFLTEYSHLVGQRGVSRLSGRGDVAHPPRLRHLQRDAARQPSRTRRGTGRDARPSVGGSFRVRYGSWFVDHRAEGVRDHRTGSHARHVRRGRRASSPRCGERRSTRATRGSSSRCRLATCCRSRTRRRTRPCGSRPATRRRSRRRRTWVSVCCASPSVASSR